MEENSVLVAHEAPAYELVNKNSRNNILIVCDHASNKIPESMNKLGLSEHELSQHIAYDIGAANVARHLSKQFDTPLIMTNYSRLVIDINRFPSDLTSIPEMSDGIEIPGNIGLSDLQKQYRIESLFDPYHLQIVNLLEEIKQRNQTPFIISLHSFTPIFDGYQRPWHIGVVWNEGKEISQQLIKQLRAHDDLCIGDNQPYRAVDPHGYTIDTHAEKLSYPHLLLEIRQDLIDTDKKALHWAKFLYQELSQVKTQHQSTNNYHQI